MPKILIVNCETGKEIIRDMTAEEIANLPKASEAPEE